MTVYWVSHAQSNCQLIHRYCHALKLAVGDAIKNVPVLKESLEDAYELTKLIRRKENLKLTTSI